MFYMKFTLCGLSIVKSLVFFSRDFSFILYSLFIFYVFIFLFFFALIFRVYNIQDGTRDVEEEEEKEGKEIRRHLGLSY